MTKEIVFRNTIINPAENNLLKNLKLPIDKPFSHVYNVEQIKTKQTID